MKSMAGKLLERFEGKKVINESDNYNEYLKQIEEFCYSLKSSSDDPRKVSYYAKMIKVKAEAIDELARGQFSDHD